MRTNVALLAAAVLAACAFAASPDTPKSSPDALTAKIARLIAELGNDRFEVREKAEKELAETGRPAVPALREAVKHSDLEVRMRAGRALEAIRTTPRYLREDLKDKDPVTRREAVERLGLLGDKAKEVVPDLVPLLKDSDEAVRDAAMSALFAIDPDHKALADAAPRKATVGGKYGKLLRRLHVPQDKQSYGDFTDYGHYPATDWAGYTNIPAGYWVYVAPHWYIWGEMKLAK